MRKTARTPCSFAQHGMFRLTADVHHGWKIRIHAPGTKKRPHTGGLFYWLRGQDLRPSLFGGPVRVLRPSLYSGLRMNLWASAGFTVPCALLVHGLGTNKKGPTLGACFIGCGDRI